MQEQGKTLFQATVTSVKLKSLQMRYEEGENYREFVKFSCQEKVGEICSFCCEWTGPPIERCLKPIPDHSCLLEYHYLSYQKTPKEERDPLCENS